MFNQSIWSIARFTAMSLGLLLSLGRGTAVTGSEPNGQQPPDAAKRILLITGEDYPGHKWRETAPVVMGILSQDTRVTVDVLADLKSLGTCDLSPYAAVVLHFKNYDPAVPGHAGLENLDKFVQEGGGLTLLHFACGAFEEFKDEFALLAGRVWFGQTPPQGRHQHDPRGPFTVNIAAKTHPITRGLDDFTTIDELYSCLEGQQAITPIATAVSKVDNKTYPIAFVLTRGKGRVFHCVLGHDVEAFSSPAVGQLIRRGSLWTAQLTPQASTAEK